MPRIVDPVNYRGQTPYQPMALPYGGGLDALGAGVGQGVANFGSSIADALKEVSEGKREERWMDKKLEFEKELEGMRHENRLEEKFVDNAFAIKLAEMTGDREMQFMAMKQAFEEKNRAYDKRRAKVDQRQAVEFSQYSNKLNRVLEIISDNEFKLSPEQLRANITSGVRKGKASEWLRNTMSQAVKEIKAVGLSPEDEKMAIGSIFRKAESSVYSPELIDEEVGSWWSLANPIDNPDAPQYIASELNKSAKELGVDTGAKDFDPANQLIEWNLKHAADGMSDEDYAAIKKDTEEAIKANNAIFGMYMPGFATQEDNTAFNGIANRIADRMEKNGKADYANTLRKSFRLGQNEDMGPPAPAPVGQDELNSAAVLQSLDGMMGPPAPSRINPPAPLMNGGLPEIPTSMPSLPTGFDIGPYNGPPVMDSPTGFSPYGPQSRNDGDILKALMAMQGVA